MTTGAVEGRPRFLVSMPSCASGCRAAVDRRDDSGCRFQVAWEINPHMRVGSVDGVRAVGQHRALLELLRTLGASVEALPFVHGAYDSVFIKDNGVLRRRAGADTALLARPRFVERQIEQPAREVALGRLGFRVRTDPRASFEGGDVVRLPHGRGALLGIGFRSDRRAAPTLAAFLEAEVHAVELRDPRLYHLDTALTALHDGTVAFCPEAFTRPSVEWLERAFSRASLLRVPYEDACAFALNTIEVGSHVILGGPSSFLASALKDRGYIVHVPDLTEFRAAGGSAACLVSKVQEEAPCEAVEPSRAA